jgi:hypothetical protein
VTIFRPTSKPAVAAIVVAILAIAASVLTAPPAHALPPIPKPHPEFRPPISRTHPIPDSATTLDELLPEPRPSNDPNEYDSSGINVAPNVGATTTPEPEDDGYSWDGGTDTGTVATGTSQYGGYDDYSDGGPELKSIGLIIGGLISVTSLGMWLRRR